MELTEDGFLEELLGPRREPWSSCFGSGVSDLLQSGWSFDENPELLNPSFLGLISTPTQTQTQTIDPLLLLPPTFDCCTFTEPYPSLSDAFTVPTQSNHHHHDIDEAATLPFLQEEYSSYPSAEPALSGSLPAKTIDNSSCCKVEMEMEQCGMAPLEFNMGLCCGEAKKSKKLQGQPSKNLMAERRRRKRLNDRLSMLRSIVPKISKMDRTSILGDTIDYMKELLDRINKLREEEGEETKMGTNQMNVIGKRNEVLTRNSPKFDVERRGTDTRIEICCPTRPGLLLSTVSTLEDMGIEIQQCVISCFSDFSMHASCSQGGEEQRTLINSEDIKQVLFRNAGYGGRCL